MIHLSQLTIGYKKENPLIEVSLSLPDHGIYAVVGKNGSGKSTFYKTLMGILPPLGGHISGIQQNDVLLISDYTGLPGEVKLRDLCHLLFDKAPDLSNILNGQADILYDKPIKNLSSGQRKIAEITLGQIKGKKILLLDEAANALDDENTYEFHKYILEASQSSLILYTTHNLQEIVDLKIPLLCIRGKTIALHEPVSDVKAIRDYIGFESLERS